MSKTTIVLNQKVLWAKEKLAAVVTAINAMFTEIYAFIDTVTTFMSTSKTKTIKFTVGAVGVAGCDFNFTTAANTTKQVKDLGAIIPAFARIRDVVAVTTTLFAGTGISAFGVEAGSTSGGAEHWASADLILANAIGQQAVGAGFTPLAITAAAQHVYISGTPTGGNWSALTAGKLTVYITYTERN